MTQTAEALRFSIIVASWDRPFWLKRCLRALSQLEHSNFEIVVVADQQVLSQIDGAGMKLVPFSEPNLSRARNAGIAASGGDICAFVDDDAVPEPMWLAYLEDAFRRTQAGAVAGYVRGRNGISYQTQVASVDAEAETHIEPTATQPVVPKLKPGRALKLVGTNMAIRRDILAMLGGFDDMFHYFLEDTDLSLRVANAGYAMAVAPLAEVHHAFAPSPRRTKLRAPVDLYDIGRSTALFLRRHYQQDYDEMFGRMHRRERARLLRHMVNGSCEPRDIRRTLVGLKTGWDDGMNTPLDVNSQPVNSETDFQSFHSETNGQRVIGSRLLHRRRGALRKATKLAEKGKRVSLFSFSLTLFRHQLHYTSEGRLVADRRAVRQKHKGWSEFLGGADLPNASTKKSVALQKCVESVKKRLVTGGSITRRRVLFES